MTDATRDGLANGEWDMDDSLSSTGISGDLSGLLTYMSAQNNSLAVNDGGYVEGTADHSIAPVIWSLPLDADVIRINGGASVVPNNNVAPAALVESPSATFGPTDGYGCRMAVADFKE
jgi:hypothetical protein